MDLANKRVLVVGLGRSGVASALFLQARGARVTVSDAKPQDQLGEDIPVLLDHGIVVETGGHGERTFRGQDLIVVSPGVPVDSPPLVQARVQGELVIGEIELASRFRRRISSPSLGRMARRRLPLWQEKLCRRAVSRRWWAAISARQRSLWWSSEGRYRSCARGFELSTGDNSDIPSENCGRAQRHPDHLDRHRTFAAYTDAKARIFENQQADDFAVLNADDPTCVELASRIRTQVVLV